MDKQCSQCGKTLTFRNTFMWEKREVCKECLQTLRGDARPETAEPEKKISGKKEKPVPFSREALKKDLRGWGIGLIILALFHFSNENLDAAWGAVILVLGIINLIVMKKEMLIANGIALLGVGIMNIVTGFSHSETTFWAVFGFFQLFWGVKEFTRYAKYKTSLETEEAAAETESIAAAAPYVTAESFPSDPESIRDADSLFRVKPHGINFILGAALTLGFLVMSYLWQIQTVFHGQPFTAGGLGYFIGSLFSGAVLAALFLVLNYTIQDWKLRLGLFGLGNAVISILFQLPHFLRGGVRDQGMFFIAIFLSNIIWGICFLYGFRYSVSRWGVSILNLMMGMAGSMFASRLINSLLFLLLVKGTRFQFGTFPISLLSGIVFGIALYYGIVLFLKRKYADFSAAG